MCPGLILEDEGMRAVLSKKAKFIKRAQYGIFTLNFSKFRSLAVLHPLRSIWFEGFNRA